MAAGIQWSARQGLGCQRSKLLVGSIVEVEAVEVVPEEVERWLLVRWKEEA